MRTHKLIRAMSKAAEIGSYAKRDPFLSGVRITRVGVGGTFTLYLDQLNSATGNIAKYAINWGDGSSTEEVLHTKAQGVNPMLVTHTYNRTGCFVITIKRVGEWPNGGNFVTEVGFGKEGNDHKKIAKIEIGDNGDFSQLFEISAPEQGVSGYDWVVSIIANNSCRETTVGDVTQYEVFGYRSINLPTWAGNVRYLKVFGALNSCFLYGNGAYGIDLLNPELKGGNITIQESAFAYLTRARSVRIVGKLNQTTEYMFKSDRSWEGRINLIDLSNTTITSLVAKTFNYSETDYGYAPINDLILPQTLSTINTCGLMCELKNLVLLSTTPPQINDVWAIGLISNTTRREDVYHFERIYVPDSSVSAYQNSQTWGVVAESIYPLSEYGS